MPRSRSLKYCSLHSLKLTGRGKSYCTWLLLLLCSTLGVGVVDCWGFYPPRSLFIVETMKFLGKGLGKKY